MGEVNRDQVYINVYFHQKRSILLLTREERHWSRIIVTTEFCTKYFKATFHGFKDNTEISQHLG